MVGLNTQCPFYAAGRTSACNSLVCQQGEAMLLEASVRAPIHPPLTLC